MPRACRSGRGWPRLLCALVLGALLSAGARDAAALTVTLDFSFDSAGFFDDPDARAAMAAAAGLFEGFADSLDAISPGGLDTWDALFSDPGTGTLLSLTDLSVAADEVIVFAGARDLPGSALGQGGPGGFSVTGTQEFVDTVVGRGQAGALASPATDFGPWGGSVAFDSGTAWHFGLDPMGLDAGEFDFLSVAVHELAHLFGFGTSAVWDAFVSGQSFTGPAAAAEHGGAVPLASDLAHFANGTTSDGQEAAMDPSIAPGTRKLPTALDVAVFEDLGWQNATALESAVAVPEAERGLLVAGALLLLAGILSTRRAGPHRRDEGLPPRPPPGARRRGLPRSRGSVRAIG